MHIPDSGRPKAGLIAGWSRVFTYGVLQSILAFSFYAASCLALQNTFAWDYSLLIITGTLGVYNGHLLIKTFLNERKWAAQNIIFLLLIGISGLYILFNFNSGIEYLRHLVIPVIIASLYLLPFSKIINAGFIPGWIKPVSLAVSWTWICLGPPKILDFQVLLFINSIFFLILSNALMFDVKDVEMDKHMNKSTFANNFGWKMTQRAAFISLFISMIALGLFYHKHPLGLLISPLILGLYYIPLIKTKTDSPQNQYYWYLDGGLFLFPVAVCLIQLISNKL